MAGMATSWNGLRAVQLAVPRQRGIGIDCCGTFLKTWRVNGICGRVPDVAACFSIRAPRRT